GCSHQRWKRISRDWIPAAFAPKWSTTEKNRISGARRGDGPGCFRLSHRHEERVRLIRQSSAFWFGSDLRLRPSEPASRWNLTSLIASRRASCCVPVEHC